MVSVCIFTDHILIRNNVLVAGSEGKDSHHEEEKSSTLYTCNTCFAATAQQHRLLLIAI